MAIRSTAIGATLAPQQITVTPRMILAYAAGIEDKSACTFDDADIENFIAPPSFCVSPEWQLIIAARSNVFNLAPGEARSAVHASQDSQFHRPIRAGDDLTTSGQVVLLRQSRAGIVAISRLETCETISEAPVVTTWTTSMYRGLTLEGDDAHLPGQAPPQMAQGSTLDHSIEIPIDRWFAHRYTECANIWNPIHTERAVALAADLPNIIVHGTALWALAGREIVDRFCQGNPARLKRLAGRFSAMVIPGSAIQVEMGQNPDHPGNITFLVRNSGGQTAVSHGSADIAI